MGARGCCILLLLGSWSMGLWAQSDLVTLQKQEKERRKRAKASTHILTDESRVEDVKGVSKVGINILVSEAKADKTASPDKAQTAVPTPQAGVSNEETVEGKGKSHWVSRRMDLLEDIANLKAKADALQVELNNAIAARVREVLPVKYVELTETIEKKQVELAEAQSGLQLKEKELDDFLESARRAGVPPGWFREQ